jgi:class 3 adenylate cyclase
MTQNNRPPVTLILVSSILIGILIAFGYEPLYEIINGFLKTNAKLGNLHDLAVTLALGSVYLGLLIYFYTIFVTGAVTRKIFYYLLSELKRRELLPVTFKMKKHRGFVHIYRDIKTIFDLFIKTFMDVKEDKDKFVKAVEMHLDPTVKEHLDGRGINEMYLNNKKITATILFSDLRGFTSYTETHEANDVITILNEYFTETTKIIKKYNGKVNKYIGDAVLAVFEEAPKYKDYLDCDQAIIASLDMQTQYQFLLKKWKEKIDPLISIGLGVGLARGEVIAGTIGSEERMEYTVIGDTVNFASRLCNKAFDGQVLISDDIYSLVSKFVEVETLAPVEVKGKTGTYSLYSVITRRMVI